MACRKMELVDWDDVFRRMAVEATEPLPNAVIAKRIGMTSKTVADARRAFEERSGATVEELRARRRTPVAAAFRKRASRASKAALPSPTKTAADWSW